VAGAALGSGGAKEMQGYGRRTAPDNGLNSRVKTDVLRQRAQVMQRRKTINDSLQQNSGPFCLYFAFALMAVTLAECLANSWQSGLGCQVPPIGQGNHPSGRSAYQLMGRGNCHTQRLPASLSALTALHSCQGMPSVSQEPPSQCQALVFARNVLAGLIAPPSSLPHGHTLCPGSHAGPSLLDPPPACLAHSQACAAPASPDRGRSLGP